MMQTSAENPFQFNEPIQEPDLFFGRRDEVRRILDFIRKSQCASVVGPSRIGKTSLLNYLSSPLVLREHGLSESACLFAYIDCQELAYRDREGCFNHIGSQIGQQAAQQYGIDIVIRHATSFTDLETICEKLRQSGLKPVVIVLDGFGSLVRNSLLNRDFYSNLRSLHTNFGVGYLTTSEEPLAGLEQEYVLENETDSSPFCYLFDTFSLGPLNQDESRSLLRHYFALVGFTIPNLDMSDVPPKPQQIGKNVIRLLRHILDALRIRLGRYRHPADSTATKHWGSITDSIVKQTAGHPYLLQWVGWHVIDVWHQHSDRWNYTCWEELLKCFDGLPRV